MEHVKIPVIAIHPNPHRDFKRNPLREDQVDKIMDSIGRTGFWDNVVVREHPEIAGAYQLAYGHSRLEAVKRVGIAEVSLPVAEMSDWEMYCAMVDENETQQAITPAIAFENVETGVELLERAFKTIGPDGDYEGFNEALGRSVPRGTDLRDKRDGGFEKVRNAFFRDEGIGRVFIKEVLPSGKLNEHVISEVLNSHYGQQRAEAKSKQAEDKQKEAEAKSKQAEDKQKEAEEEEDETAAQEAEAEAQRLREEAEKAGREAAKLEAEARRIGEGSIDDKILLTFKTPRQMTAFAQAIKAAKIPKIYHRKAMEYARKEKLSVREMSEKLDLWWYSASGQQEKDRKRHEKEEALKRFSKRYKEGDLGQYLLEMGAKIRSLTSDMKVVSSAVGFYENERHRAGLIRDLKALIEQSGELIANLSDAEDSDPDAIDVEYRDGDDNRAGRTGTNGVKDVPSLI